MTLLLLGGTQEAKQLATSLYEKNIKLIYSIAGLVRIPSLACEIAVGGFSQWGGLAQFIQQKNISAILDVTHPYAQNMSVKAQLSAQQAGIPYWRFQRPGWQAQAGDDWHHFEHWNDLLVALTEKKSVFFSAGQLSKETIEVLKVSAKNGQQQLLRTAAKPIAALPDNMVWLKSIGPFNKQAESEILKAYKIDCLVTKNSGGSSTQQKIIAARELNIPVFMLQRPKCMPCPEEFNQLIDCEAFVTHWHHKHREQNDR